LTCCRAAGGGDGAHPDRPDDTPTTTGLGGVVADAMTCWKEQYRRTQILCGGNADADLPRRHGGEDDLDSSYASNAKSSPGLADKPRRRWYVRDDLGVVRIGVN
jgi:hypothetical protein